MKRREIFFDIHKGSQIKITMLVKKILSLDKSYKDTKKSTTEVKKIIQDVGCRKNDKNPSGNRNSFLKKKFGAFFEYTF